jgi:tetratricopeptide (TPR) repeat protein
MYGLLAAYTNEKDYDLAFEMADRLYEKYPKNPNLLYRRGTLHQEFERWQEARAAYGELYTVLQETPYQSRSFQVECLYRMALCEFKLGNKIETKRLSIEANKVSETCDFAKELDGPLISFEDVKEELVSLTAKVEDIQLSEAQLPDAGKTTE